jgi:RNA polymerase sigma-70 factor (ECF subfamily)
VTSRNEPDRDAIEACRRNDTDGLRRLYERYRTRVFRSCLRILGDEPAAEDATQEIFVKLYGKIGSFNGHSLFSTWLFRLTVNHSLNLLDKRKRARPQADLAAAAELPAAAGALPDRQLAEDEQSRALARVLARLTAEHRVVLVLREIEELSYREIGAVLELPAGTVMSRLARARRELRKHWRAAGPHGSGNNSGNADCPKVEELQHERR